MRNSYYNQEPTPSSPKALKAVLFMLHAASAVFLAVCATRCGSSYVTPLFAESMGSVYTGYAVRSLDSKNSTCINHKNRSCFFAIPEARDVAQIGLEWNVFALLAAFEWISASFALGHLSGNFNPFKRPPQSDVSQIKLLSLAWNLAGALWLLIPGNVSLLQAGITLLALLIATSVQYYPVGGEDDAAIVMHYTEYCTSASLLFLGVLILYIPDPQSWAVIIGFTGMLLCNITGVAAHLCKLDAVEGRTQLPFFDLDWGKVGNHFKLYILHSWLGMITALLIIVYLARSTFFNKDVPWWVTFILINLLVTYTLFGVWATACYAIADTKVKEYTPRMQMVGQEECLEMDPQFELWVSGRLGYGLTVLSAAAKLPVAFTVFYGLIGMPGDSACSVF